MHVSVEVWRASEGTRSAAVVTGVGECIGQRIITADFV